MLRELNLKPKNLIITSVTFFTLFFVQHAVNAKSKDNIVKIKDVKGVIDTVRNLKAQYTAGGNWLGSRPERLLEAMIFLLFENEGRTTFENKIEINFSQMRSLKFIPRENGIYVNKCIIEKNDGSILIISNQSFIEKDNNGKTIKENKLSYYTQKVGSVQGEDITFDGFRGIVEKNGRKGEYFIPGNDVSEIIFE